MSNLREEGCVNYKISKKGLLILETLFCHQETDIEGDGKLYGAQIKKMTEISSGTLYPAIEKLVNAGLIECERESTEKRLKRPPRHYYNINMKGMAELEKQKKSSGKKVHFFRSKLENEEVGEVVGQKKY